MTESLTFTEIESHVGRGWKVEGRRGAVSFHLEPQTIEYHSRLPLYAGDEPTCTCPHVDFPCYFDGSGPLGRALADSWGGDADVVRAELERLYGEVLPEPADVR